MSTEDEDLILHPKVATSKVYVYTAVYILYTGIVHKVH